MTRQWGLILKEHAQLNEVRAIPEIKLGIVGRLGGGGGGIIYLFLFLLLYILVTSKVISGQVPTCDSAK